MTEKSGRRLRFWQPAWWLPELRKCDRTDSCQRIAESSAPKPTYYVLIVLSTLIASYGLLSNSTATVIGAMIVAPLMGPILGLALGTVLADSRMFYRSLAAESSGVVMVILTGLLVAMVVGPEHIDYAGAEIAGRTRPTLYDFAIGLAAGLAGGYCTVHPGLQSSVAGVAIAVALVPPLAVTGLTGAGWLSGEIAFKPVFGSFMLFFTNLLTIELASGFVFLGTGFRRSGADNPKELWRKTLVVKAILLIATGIFLTNQLSNLLQERYGLVTSRRELQTMLKDIPGANLDSLEVQLNRDVLTVTAVVGSRTDVEPPVVKRFQDRLNKALRKGLPNIQAQLVVRTVNSTYASSNGYLFEPTRSGLDDDERRSQALDVALRDLLEAYPGVDLVDFFQSSVSNRVNHQNTSLTITLNSPYDFGPRFVRELEESLNKEISKDPSLFAGYTYKLLVKTILVKTASANDAVAMEAPEMRTPEEVESAQRQERLRQLLTSSLELNGHLKVLELHVRRVEPAELKSSSPVPTPTPVTGTQQETDHYAVRLTIRSPQLIGPELLAAARDQAETVYTNETGHEVEVNIDSTISVGSDLYLDQESPIAQTAGESEDDKEERLNQLLNDHLSKYVARYPRAELNGTTDLQKLNDDGSYLIYAVVTSEKPIPNKTLIQWQKALVKVSPAVKSLELNVENRLGRSIRLTPVRQPEPKPAASPKVSVSPKPANR